VPAGLRGGKGLDFRHHAADKDYPKVGGNLGNQNYSSLDANQQAQHQNLGAAWSLKVSAAPVTVPVPGPGTTTTGQQTSPIVVDGVIYSDTPGGGVIAVNGKDGTVKWKWMPNATILRP
jgi:glucose dehydrogenase